MANGAYFIEAIALAKENGFADRFPVDIEILVHPVFDRDGVVIDSRGEKDGYPIGEPLRDFGKIDGVVLQSYCDLE